MLQEKPGDGGEGPENGQWQEIDKRELHNCGGKHGSNLDIDDLFDHVGADNLHTYGDRQHLLPRGSVKSIETYSGFRL